ncbi:MAG TPA: class I SAM-dependent rRNA methyltransferase, partial [Polyangia bacterium]
AGHPWIFRDALADSPSLAEGTTVLVRGRDRRPIGRGFWDATAPIAVRVLTTTAGQSLRDLVYQRIAEALAERRTRLAGTDTTAFRWIHGEADRLPGVHVDVYDTVAAVRFDGGGARAFYRALAAQLLEVDTTVRAVIDRQSRALLAGDPGALAACTEVRENGLRFAVDLAHGQKGGLFLDQRENRAEIRRRAAGKRVLNLFGYTGGFSVYAAAGGASATCTVDVAAPAIAAAADNFARNGLDRTHARFCAEDAFAFLTAARDRGELWDIVISDPPSFAPNQRALPAARAAYRRLHALAAAVTAPDGLFCPASCSSHFPWPEFRASVEDGVRAAGRRFVSQHEAGAGFDHPVRAWFPEGDYLKFAIGAVPVGPDSRGRPRSNPGGPGRVHLPNRSRPSPRR